MRKIFFVFAFMVALCLSSSAALAVEIGLPSTLAAGANLGGTQVRFGNNTAPGTNGVAGSILWHVVATDHTNKKATLWTTSNMGNMVYHPSGNHNSWSGSDICHWLNGIGSYDNDGFLQNAFSAAEQAAIEPEYGTEYEPYGVGESWAGTIDSRQKIVLPSVGEIGNGTNTGDWDINQATRGFGASWWLRSPGHENDLAALVNSVGNVSVYGLYVYDPLAARPAFVLDLQSILFTSAAEGGKNFDGGLGLWEVTGAPTGAVKFTVLDTTGMTSGTVTATGANSNEGTSITVNVTGATPNARLSAIVVYAGNAITHYGQIGDTDDSGAANVTLTLPVTLGAGNTLKIFTEEINGDNLTDFASEPVTVMGSTDDTRGGGGGGCNAGVGLFGALAMLAAYLGRRRK